MLVLCYIFIPYGIFRNLL